MRLYNYADKEIARLNRYFIHEFMEYQPSKFDELNILKSAKAMYARMDGKARQAFVRIAKNQYGDITPLVALALLEEYDPVTKYVYSHEVERKRMRFAEAYIAGGGNRNDTKSALRLWSNMVRQYAIVITDYALILKYKSEGIKHVTWITEEDERRCGTCAGRHGKIYPIDEIPPKPHIGCRCYYVPVQKGGDVIA